jgi:hypothetical protein
MNPLTMDELADRVKAALETADLEAYRELLDPDATWGPPDGSSPCRNREQVLEWYQRGRAAGGRATVIEVVAGTDKLLVGLRIAGTPPAAAHGGEEERWQVLTVKGGKVADIRGFEERAEAAARAGVADS